MVSALFKALTIDGRSGGTRTHGLQYPKLARYHLRYASICEKTIEFCCGQLCGQGAEIGGFSEMRAA